MANEVERLIRLIFEADNKTGPAIKQLSGSIEDVGAVTGRGIGVLADFTTTILKLEVGAAAAGLALTGFAVNAAGKFDESVREIVTLVNGGAEDVAKLKDQIIGLAPSASSFDDVTQAVYAAVSATGDLQGSLAVQHQAEQLAIAGRADLSESTLLLVSSLNAYGVSLDQAGHFSDVFFAAVQQGQTTIPELAQGFAQLAPLAHAAGLSLEETVGAVVTLTKQGVPTAQALTGVRAALANILNPSGKAAESAQQLGVQFDANALASQGLAGFLEKLATATGGNISQMNTFFGSVEGLSAVMALTSNNGQTLTGVLAALANSEGNAAKAAELMSDTLKVHTQRMINALTALGDAIGEPLLKPFFEVEDAVTHLLDRIRIAVEAGAFQPLIDATVSALHFMRDSITQIAQEIPTALEGVDFTRTLEEIDKLVNAVRGIFPADLDLSSGEGLTTVLQNLVNIGTQFIAFARGVIEFYAPLIRGFLEIGSAAGQSDTSVAALGGHLGAISQVLTLLSPLLGPVSAGVNLIAASLNLASAGGLALSASLSPLLVPLGVLAGLVTTAGLAWVAYRAYTNDAKQAQDEMTAAQQRSREEALAQAAASGAVTGAGGALLGVMTRLIETADQQAATAAKSREEFTLWAPVADALGGSLTKTADGLIEVVVAQKALSTQTQEARKEVALLTGAMQLSQDLSEELSEKGFFQMGERLVYVGQSADEMKKATTDAMSETFEQTLKAQEQVNEFALAWEQIQSDERQLVFQLSADIAIEQIQAGTDQVKAAFESINTTIQSTADNFNSLVGAFVQLQGSAAQSTIGELLREQLALQKQAQEQQKGLIQAQVSYLNAITERLGQGEAMISINAEGLQPSLKSVIFDMIKLIQVEANAQGQQFLLGLPAA